MSREGGVQRKKRRANESSGNVLAAVLIKVHTHFWAMSWSGLDVEM